jgi:2-oxoglutarate/2-oxoacid ferredoxin oxidoreductase subunit beta
MTPSGTLNRIGLPRAAYKGAPTTLCSGCGHNSITNHLIKALHELGIEPHRLVKMSGIGCSSKTPAYFVERAHGLNGVHGRMAPLATGTHLANHDLVLLGVSGDGDTVSIGLGQFLHLVRRNVNCAYIIEDNGTYGLTRGQLSATADLGSVERNGAVNSFHPMDPCSVALAAGCTFVARSFSGDGTQLVPLIQAAIAHRGTALLDVISPCVTFNDHVGSTRSYHWVREHDQQIQDLSFVPSFQEEIAVEYEPGSTVEVELFEQSALKLRKLGHDHDPSDRAGAQRLLEASKNQGQLVTGLLYVDPEAPDFASQEQLCEQPLRDLTESDLRLTREQFSALMSELA